MPLFSKRHAVGTKGLASHPVWSPSKHCFMNITTAHETRWTQCVCNASPFLRRGFDQLVAASGHLVSGITAYTCRVTVDRRYPRVQVHISVTVPLITMVRPAWLTHTREIPIPRFDTQSILPPFTEIRWQSPSNTTSLDNGLLCQWGPIPVRMYPFSGPQVFWLLHAIFFYSSQSSSRSIRSHIHSINRIYWCCWYLEFRRRCCLPDLRIPGFVPKVTVAWFIA
jgi:hypothetical protein